MKLGLDGVKNIVVVGLGMTGLSVVNHLLRQPQELGIKVIDTRVAPPSLDKLPASIPVHSGGWNLEWLLSADLVVANPGIALATKELQAVAKAGIPIVGDIELFAWSVAAPVVAITGSNGKSTVTSLVGEMAASAGVNVAVGGNIGYAALDLLEQDAELYVLELSSFQLETTASLKLKAAAFLNLSEDHMDRYQGMSDYREAKLRIFEHAEVCIVNRDDPATHPAHTSELVSFGFDEQQYGVMLHDGSEWLSVHGKPVLPCQEIGVVGRHNIANCLAALALTDAAGVEQARVLEAIKSYTGLTHRCQVVADNDGIRWVNDSKATNVASTMAALSGLVLDGTLHLLVGGDGKGADFSELAAVLAPLNVHLHCYGADGDAFMSLHETSVRWNSMEEAIAAITPTLKSGDMVMLSPACASFDQFKNFMARGEEFTRLAQFYSGEKVQ
ncbi:UDP-N-acetylmuramoyl-L-alanine--D-glutamate ligase [Vibrio sp. Of7-15]|uniref:UDP-N-acetylmuramoyl-L-alanine--D-glutamate ligase n=1 Tax=Vibrio sp. Of7-15 TaxID=2724879 RepID=UPI001EF26772|nr:UDP-N-acetylmuramoyl-L-alanine--D-glutamate ligase [Vibrio sp. Of7-15]MCG7498181.1 UDP-N-acetylmuramoyl-L-alanine--D-glutamate ligase [Vibrio sp. Of7-15]